MHRNKLSALTSLLLFCAGSLSAQAVGTQPRLDPTDYIPSHNVNDPNMTLLRELGPGNVMRMDLFYLGLGVPDMDHLLDIASRIDFGERSSQKRRRISHRRMVDRPISTRDVILDSAAPRTGQPNSALYDSGEEVLIEFRSVGT